MTAPPETIHERGRAALLAGNERHDIPPGPHSARWGVSAVLRPDRAAERRLATLTAQAAALAGSQQWQTGREGSSHITLCTFEPFRELHGPDDSRLPIFAEPLGQAAGRTGPLTFRLGGVVLADRGVLVLAEPVDDRPGELRAAVLSALGDHGRADEAYRRSVWWSSVLHFAGPVARPEALVDWADALVEAELGPFVAKAVELVRYEHRIDHVGPRTVPVTLQAFPLVG